MTRLARKLGNGPSKGQVGHLLLVAAGRSPAVHSLVNGGTFTRLDAGNRQMTAAEVTDLSYRRGVRSADSEPVAVSLAQLQTDAWRRYASTRGLKSGDMADQLLRIGLADAVGWCMTARPWYRAPRPTCASSRRRCASR